MIKVLDHGYVKFTEHWGSDERIIESARMSTDKGFLGWGTEEKPGDEKLLSYLWKNKHSTPFEMAGMTIEIQAPIFVFREWHRHRTQSYSELSARYTPIPDVNYIPSIERIMRNSNGKNKQAGTIKGAAEINEAQAELFRQELIQTCEMSEERYQRALKFGVPKELARLHIPVTRFSKMRASANLRNWLGFVTLRYADNPQEEIRDYAKVVHDILTEKFPRTLTLFDEDRK